MEVSKFLDAHSSNINRILAGQHVDIFLVKNLESFIDREFVDIEKVRIVAHYMVMEEPNFIRAISIFDKIVVEEGENYSVSLPHAVGHSVLLEGGDKFHYVENYLALKIFREDIALKLIKFVEGPNMDLAIKLYELFYVSLISAAKHFPLYKLYEKTQNRTFLKEELGLYEKLFRELKSAEKWVIIKNIPFAAMLLEMTLLDFKSLATLKAFKNYIDVIEKVRAHLSYAMGERKIVKPVMEAAMYLVKVFFS